MIQEFVDRFMAAKPAIRAELAKAQPEGYQAIVKAVVSALASDDDTAPDPERIQAVDWGHYQGTMFFVIGAAGYQPNDFWTVAVNYGSCSGCDTFEAIRSYDDTPPTDAQLDQYMTLALHIVQNIRAAQ